MNLLRRIFSNYEIIKPGGPKGCVVIRFRDSDQREKGLKLLYKNINKGKHFHLEKRYSLDNEIRYRHRYSYAGGKFVIVSENPYGGDTWHSDEFRLLSSNNIEFIDIDRVRYDEIEEVTIRG